MTDDDLPFFLRRMNLVVKNARQGVDKDRLRFAQIDTMVSQILTTLVIIPFKSEPHEFNFDGSTSRVRTDAECLSVTSTADFHHARKDINGSIAQTRRQYRGKW